MNTLTECRLKPRMVKRALEKYEAKIARKIRKTKASLGSKSVLAQSQPAQAKHFVPQRQMNDDEVVTYIENKMSNCCKVKNCFKRLFTKGSNINYNEMIEVFRNCREEIRMKPKPAKQSYLMRLYKATIINAEQFEQNELKFDEEGLPMYCFERPAFVHSWIVRSSLDVGCKKTWARLYDVTPYQLDECSKALKENFRTTAIGTRSFTDTTLHPYTYNHTEELFHNNVLNAEGNKRMDTGRHFLYFVKTESVQLTTFLLYTIRYIYRC
jgi:hypothetical protein